MTDEEGVRRTLALYCQLCDDGRFDEWADLFAEDATLTVIGRTHTGREAIKGFIAAAQPPERRGKHVCANTVIDFDGDAATARTDYVFVARAGEGGFAVTSAGRYHDRLEQSEDGRWRLTERRIVLLGDET